MTEDFGSYLKSERELRGVPLEEISTSTKIPIRFLRAMEENQFDELPGEVFIKGYIRSFAKVIGGNENELLSAYDEVKKNIPPNEQNKSDIIENKTPIGNSFIFWLSLAIILLAGVGWSINTLIQKSTENIKKSEPVITQPDQEKVGGSPKVILPGSASGIEDNLDSLKETDKSNNLMEQPSNNLSDKPIQSFTNLSTTIVKENTAPEQKVNSNMDSENKDSSSTLAASGEAPLKLDIMVKDNVWFNLAIDGSRQEDFILPKGAEKIFFGKDNFKINIGNRNGVVLKLNDKTLSLPNGDGNTVLREFIINSQLIE